MVQTRLTEYCNEEYSYYSGELTTLEFTERYTGVYTQLAEQLKSKFYTDLLHHAHTYSTNTFKGTTVYEEEQTRVATTYLRHPVMSKEPGRYSTIDIQGVILASVLKMDMSDLHVGYTYMLEQLIQNNHLVTEGSELPYVGGNIVEFVNRLDYYDDYTEVLYSYTTQIEEKIDARKELYHTLIENLPREYRSNKKLINLIWVEFICGGVESTSDARVQSTITHILGGYVRSNKGNQIKYDVENNKCYKERMSRLYHAMYTREKVYKEQGKELLLREVKFKALNIEGVPLLDLQMGVGGVIKHYMLTPYSIYSHHDKKYLLRYKPGVTMSEYDNVLKQSIGSKLHYAEVDRVLRVRKLNTNLSIEERVTNNNVQ